VQTLATRQRRLDDDETKRQVEKQKIPKKMNWDYRTCNVMQVSTVQGLLSLQSALF
jgi:hypothetical protein